MVWRLSRVHDVDTAAIGFILGDDARHRSRLPAMAADAAGVTDFTRYRHAGVSEEEIPPDFVL